MLIKRSLEETENLIRQLLKENNSLENQKLWLLWADIYDRELWKYKNYESFVSYMAAVWKYKRQAYEFVRAGKAIDSLMLDPRYEASGLLLPHTVKLAATLWRNAGGEENLENVFVMWRDYHHNNIPIACRSTGNATRIKSRRGLKSVEFLEKLDRSPIGFY